MSNSFFSDSHIIKGNDDNTIDLIINKKRRLYTNIGLFAVYAALLILSLFVI